MLRRVCYIQFTLKVQTTGRSLRLLSWSTESLKNGQILPFLPARPVSQHGEGYCNNGYSWSFLLSSLSPSCLSSGRRRAHDRPPCLSILCLMENGNLAFWAPIKTWWSWASLLCGGRSQNSNVLSRTSHTVMMMMMMMMMMIKTSRSVRVKGHGQSFTGRQQQVVHCTIDGSGTDHWSGLTRDRTDRPLCYLFTVSSKGLLLNRRNGTAFPNFTFHFRHKDEHFSFLMWWHWSFICDWRYLSNLSTVSKKRLWHFTLYL